MVKKALISHATEKKHYKEDIKMKVFFSSIQENKHDAQNSSQYCKIF